MYFLLIKLLENTPEVCLHISTPHTVQTVCKPARTGLDWRVLQTAADLVGLTCTTDRRDWVGLTCTADRRDWGGLQTAADWLGLACTADRRGLGWTGAD